MSNPNANGYTSTGGMRNASLAAYLELEQAGKLEAREKQILDFMRSHIGFDYSRRELSAMTGIELCSVTGRVNRLIKLGALEEVEPRLCGLTRKTINPVRIAA